MMHTSSKDGQTPESHERVRFLLLWALAVLFMVAVELLGLAFVDAVLR